jgi:DNA excision repair protein ERCC-6-like 2
LALDSVRNIKVPAVLSTVLRPYQEDGVQFLHRLWKEGMGGLLGDDMGLGKTIQVIAFLSAIMKKTGVIYDRDRRKNHVSKLQDGEEWKKSRTLPDANKTWPTALIIAPSSVVLNWERELETVGVYLCLDACSRLYCSGVISKLGYTPVLGKIGSAS